MLKTLEHDIKRSTYVLLVDTRIGKVKGKGKAKGKSKSKSKPQTQTQFGLQPTGYTEKKDGKVYASIMASLAIGRETASLSWLKRKRSRMLLL